MRSSLVLVPILTAMTQGIRLLDIRTNFQISNFTFSPDPTPAVAFDLYDGHITGETVRCASDRLSDPLSGLAIRCGAEELFSFSLRPGPSGRSDYQLSLFHEICDVRFIVTASVPGNEIYLFEMSWGNATIPVSPQTPSSGVSGNAGWLQNGGPVDIVLNGLLSRNSERRFIVPNTSFEVPALSSCRI